MQSHNREKKLINNFAICDGYEYRYTEITVIISAALSLWTGLCSLHGEAEQLVPRGRDLWASVTHTDDKITPLRSAV